MPAQTTETPFAEAAGVQRQPSQPAGELPQPGESADLDADSASTLAPSTFKGEIGESDSGTSHQELRGRQ